MKTEWISALTALVAVILSPIVSLYVAKRQIRASVVSANRQKWIDELRGELSELINLIMFLNMGRTTLTEKAFIEKFEKAHLIETKINLLINPHEQDHVALTKTIRDAIVEIFEKKDRDPKVLIALKDSIVSQSQAILKREWDRVKKGE